jgi:hypothetical protein
MQLPFRWRHLTEVTQAPRPPRLHGPGTGDASALPPTYDSCCSGLELETGTCGSNTDGSSGVCATGSVTL